MTYRFSPVRGIGADVPAADPTGQALAILAISAIPCLPIAAGVGAGVYIGKGKGAVAPIVGGLVGTLVSVLWLRASVAAGTSGIVPRTA